MALVARQTGDGGRAARRPAASPTSFRPSTQQRNFLTGLQVTEQHILLEARAGSGKSTTCREGAKLLPRNARAVYCCFNKTIADEFRPGLPRNCQAATMHSLGLRILREAFGQVEIEEHKVDRLAEKYFPAWDQRAARIAVCRLVSLCKNLLVDGADPELLRELAAVYGIDLPATTAAEVLGVVPEVLLECSRSVATIDFDDMIWLPVVLQQRPPRTPDVVFVDECLPGWTPIHLANGSSKTIAEIVEGKLSVEVLGYDTESGQQRPCRVIGWSRILNQKPLVKIKVRWKRRKGTNRPTNFIVCTTDHKVWADGKWTPAGEVRVGMTMQVETSAIKSQAGKITSKGRVALATAIAPRNEAGIMSRVGGPGISPRNRGGNGRGPTLPQQTLHDTLGSDWVMEYSISTGRAKDGYPKCYKIDLADPQRQIAVEIDGSSHRSPERRTQDRRKDEFLRSIGWKVIRVSNREAIQRTAEVAAGILAGDCPIGAEVVSVEPIEIPDSFVYDITVEKCHNFYANGILVHNCQDLNSCQHALLDLLSPSGRKIIVGDRWQAIYSFRGADANSIPKLDASLGLTERGLAHFPLTVTRRCPRSVVELARQLVPDLDHLPDAPEGTIEEVRPEQWAADVAEGDMVLCRTNAPLVSAAYRLIRSGVRASVRGRDIGKGILALVARLRVRDVPSLARALEDYRSAELSRLSDLRNASAGVQALNDRCDCLAAIAEGATSIEEVKARAESMFTDLAEHNCVSLSSIHRAKGLERDRVVILRPELIPGPWATTKEDLQQERNLGYVAVTRAKQRLTFAGDVPSLFDIEDSTDSKESIDGDHRQAIG